jgi:uncharacterized protein (DUF2147 family)
MCRHVAFVGKRAQYYRRTACLLAAVVLSLVGEFGTAEASQADGTWRIHNLVLRIYECQQSMCGRIIWIEDAAKRPSQCGQTIIWGLAPLTQNEWAGGSILDPNDGNIYQLSATYEPDGTLRARIFKGVPVFGKTEILNRVDVRNFTGQC